MTQEDWLNNTEWEFDSYADAKDVGRVTVIFARRPLAILIRFNLNLKELWVPRSVIHPESQIPANVRKSQQQGVLRVASWFARKNDL